ncbi:isocitrate dehydrogenase (NAD+) [Sporomusaceae bacterium BoRhaA]|uniref:isocitrate/isopropylmalate dehydrogenase family protein n=1 Tax=Pelorhabdus rhamnosifermentans TaxID=2772457 RepID=UPI001C0634F1|nr:isocitrate/isopropylmalate dehydrogenase family protein [Pelorhabdus rhamnosifermentans]MBU2699121.1 isocitrate dehydrogenase (NAD+) [Pelorhabdus rhamnosifermentans]
MKITLIPGDGIGPEVTAAAVEVLAAAGADIEWETVEIGAAALKNTGAVLPDEALATIQANRFALKGPVTTPVGKGFRSVNVALRQTLNLYANVRPVKSFAGIPSRFTDVDLVIVRENTEDLYAGIEHAIGDVAAESIKLITASASERIAQFAFDYVREHQRHDVTAVHKANIMKLSDGLFLRSCEKIAQRYEDIPFHNCIVDAMCMNLVLHPENYDVLVLPNLYGDIVSDLCSGLVGGLGMAPGANIGANGAVFEAVHGSAPDLAGKNLANPIAAILSGVLLLRHIGQSDPANKIAAAVEQTLREQRDLTADLGGTATTSHFTESLCQLIAEAD